MRAVFVDDSRCLSCHSCELACVVQHSPGRSLYQAIAQKSPPRPRIHVEAVPGGAFPLQCRQCSDPYCVRACTAKALYTDASGAVLHDASRCIGCTMCVLACPFGLIEDQPADDNSCAVSKCDLCASEGANPVCVEACPTGALSFEETNTYSQDKRRAYLVELATERRG